MRVLLCTPRLPPVGGNVTTVRRIATHLEALKVTVQIVTTEALTEETRHQAKSFRPDVVHAFHAFRAGIGALEIAKETSAPLVVTITGTDINIDVLQDDKKEPVLTVLKASSAITTFSPPMTEAVSAVDRDLAKKIRIIYQGVWFRPQETGDVRADLGIETNVPVFLLAANVRSVKRPILAIEGVQLLRQRGCDAHLVLAGEILELNEWQRVRTILDNRAWAHYIGSVPPEKIVSLYRAADIVLNTSEHEGGMANTLVEAMWLKRPTLASAIPGNSWLVRNEETGLLFNDEHELAEMAVRLLTDQSLVQRLVRNAYQWVRFHCDPIKEAKEYISLYSLLL